MVLALTLGATGALVLAALTSATRLPGSDARRTARRLRWVARHPERANAGDIRSLLARGLPGDQVDLVCERAATLRLAPFTMLLWLQRHGVEGLALAVAADLRHEQLLGHLARRTRPDLEQLRVLAGLNGLRCAPAAAHQPRARHSATCGRSAPIVESSPWPG